MVTRDSESTKLKILAAATEAFVALGPAGARVDAIAAAAGVNKRMLYHHFGDKQGLYQAVLAASEGEADQLSEQRARLLAWEGLSQVNAGEVREGTEPPLSPGSAIEPLAEPVANLGLDAQMFALLQVALQVFPHVCGPEVKRLTGLTPGSDAFEAALGRLQDQIKRQLDPQSRAKPPKTKVRLRGRTMPRSST